MTALDFLSQPLWQRLTFALLHFVWQGALVGLLLALGLVFARRATTRYSLALLALGAITICPLITALWQPGATTEVLPMVATSSAVGTTADASWSLAELTFWQPYVLLAWLVGVLLLSGIFRSVGFTTYNSAAFADVAPERMTGANTLMSTLQELGAGLGVAVGALLVRLGEPVAGAVGLGPGAAEPFRVAFVLLAVILAGPLVEGLLLSRTAGNEVTGRA